MHIPLAIKEAFLLSYQFTKTAFVSFQKIHKKKTAR